ncbi:MAG: acetyl-CoA C-acyltransferase FadI [Myxococcota bacterium]
MLILIGSAHENGEDHTLDSPGGHVHRAAISVRWESGVASKAKFNGTRRVAIVDGLRTPFVKAGTYYRNLSALELACTVVTELLQRSELDVALLDLLVFGQVVPNPAASNIAREIVLGCAMPPQVDAYSVSRACATSTQALVDATRVILMGEADVAICGGSDSLSRPPMTYSDGFVDVLMAAQKAKTPLGKAKAFFELAPKDLIPKAPALRELSTGLSMGESAEKMAKDNGISRAAQDAFALSSQHKAAMAWEQGVFQDEVMSLPLPPDFAQTLHKDTLIRPDTTLEKLHRLRPVFDERYGSVTAGNSSPLTDGASAVLLMEERLARELGYEPLAFVRAWGFTALDPTWQLLMGPAFATAMALERADTTLEKLDFIDMHEAFAAQILSNLQAFSSKAFAKKHLGRTTALGDIDPEKFNVYGGSIALGHPFAATGTRQALTMAHALKRQDSGTALVTQCAAGGLGAALILER